MENILKKQEKLEKPNCNEKCFAETGGKCNILTDNHFANKRCPLQKMNKTDISSSGKRQLYNKLKKMRYYEARKKVYQEELIQYEADKEFVIKYNMKDIVVQETKSHEAPHTTLIERIDESKRKVAKKMLELDQEKQEVIDLIEKTPYLEEEERILLRLKYLYKKTNEEIGKVIHLSESSVRRVHNDAIDKLTVLNANGDCGTANKVI